MIFIYLYINQLHVNMVFMGPFIFFFLTIYKFCVFVKVHCNKISPSSSKKITLFWPFYSPKFVFQFVALTIMLKKYHPWKSTLVDRSKMKYTILIQPCPRQRSALTYSNAVPFNAGYQISKNRHFKINRMNPRKIEYVLKCKL